MWKPGNVLVVLDVGGTNIRINHIDPQDGKMGEHGHSFPARDLGADPVGKLSLEIQAYSKGNDAEIGAVVVGLPASFDEHMERIIKCNNLPLLEGCPLACELHSRLGVPVYLEHDTMLLLLGETRLLGLDESSTVLGVFLGTGIGADVLYRGKPFRLSHTSFELGHIPVRPNGRKCVCGKKGCVEAYSNGHLLEKIARRSGIHVKDVFSFWDTGSGNDAELHRIVDYAAMAIATAVTLFSPSHVVIGGGVVSMQGYPREYLVEKVKEKLCAPYPLESVCFHWAKGGSAASVYGAVKLANGR